MRVKLNGCQSMRSPLATLPAQNTTYNIQHTSYIAPSHSLRFVLWLDNIRCCSYVYLHLITDPRTACVHEVRHKKLASGDSRQTKRGRATNGQTTSQCDTYFSLFYLTRADSKADTHSRQLFIGFRVLRGEKKRIEKNFNDCTMARAQQSANNFFQ